MCILPGLGLAFHPTTWGPAPYLDGFCFRIFSAFALQAAAGPTAPAPPAPALPACCRPRCRQAHPPRLLQPVSGVCVDRLALPPSRQFCSSACVRDKLQGRPFWEMFGAETSKPRGSNPCSQPQAARLSVSCFSRLCCILPSEHFLDSRPSAASRPGCLDQHRGPPGPSPGPFPGTHISTSMHRCEQKSHLCL